MVLQVLHHLFMTPQQQTIVLPRPPKTRIPMEAVARQLLFHLLQQLSPRLLIGEKLDDVDHRLVMQWDQPVGQQSEAVLEPTAITLETREETEEEEHHSLDGVTHPVADEEEDTMIIMIVLPFVDVDEEAVVVDSNREVVFSNRVATTKVVEVVDTKISKATRCNSNRVHTKIMMNIVEEVNVLARKVMIIKMIDMAATAAMVILLENESGDKAVVVAEEDTTVMTAVEDGVAAEAGVTMAVVGEVLLTAVAIEVVAVVVIVEEEEGTMVGEEEVVMVEEVDIKSSLEIIDSTI
mmetsp:Transcript_24455/g.29391  ORF Transcript_24455/g.29391 Transcript_24455/m.29391 type:complete len:294 (-) Transcript_24455:150-1031(-)